MCGRGEREEGSEILLLSLKSFDFAKDFFTVEVLKVMCRKCFVVKHKII